MAEDDQQLKEPLATWPQFGEEEIAAATRVLKSGRVNYWTGDEGKRFESEFASWVGAAHGVAMANGTVAIEAALEAAGIGPGDEVIVPPRTFIASASAVVRVGARPVFADVEPDSGNISSRTIEPVLTDNTKGIIAVHLGGWPVDMDPILALAASRSLTVIEDCAQSHGATYNGRMTGSLGHMAAFSFCQDKIITTAGEGGMVTTNDPLMWKRLWSIKDHGKDYDTVFNTEHPTGFRWLHHDFATNFRMTEIQAAVGRVALTNVDAWVAARRRNAAILTEALSGIPGVRIPTVPRNMEHAYYRCHFYIVPDALKAGWTRDRIQAELESHGVPARSGSCSEIYLEHAFEKNGLAPTAPLPIARELGETSLTLPVHPTLSPAAVHSLAAISASVIDAACR